MTGYEFGDVILVPFPFTDRSTSKRRPAVVLSSDAYQPRAAGSHHPRHHQPGAPTSRAAEVAVAKWKEAGLLKPSVLKPVVATLERGLVLRKLGRLEDEDRKALRKVLGEILGS
jgi:mRNA interferase MazF